MSVLRRRVAVATASGVAVAAGTFLVAGFSPRWVVVAIAQTVLLALPDAALAAGIQGLGSAAQPLLVVGAAGLAVALFGGLALLALRIGRVADRERSEVVFLVGALQALAAFLLAVTPAAAVIGGALGAAVVGLAGASATGTGEVSRARRGLLRSVGAAAAAVGLAGAGPIARAIDGGAGESGGSEAVDLDPLVERLLAVAAERSFDLAGAEPLVSESFYVVDKNAADPEVDPEEWSLRVTGAVNDEVEIDLDSVTARPAEHRFVTLRCVGDPVNGRKLDTAVWTGVPVADLLDEAGVRRDGCCVMLRAADGYYEEFPLSALDGGLLAYRMNGRPLPQGHGAPVRALIPGHWGEINVKWLTEIEVLEEEATGYWEVRGWHGTGPVSTVAKLHHVEVDDGAVSVGGHAYAGTRGVSAVEVSTDGGDTWTEAELTERLPEATPADASPNDPEAVDGEATDAWRGWRHEYEATDEHEVVVRAVEADGTVQPAAERDPFPSGASGRASRTVRP
ncbi:molybdopterin-dependent oxidoreductase [Halobaculum gomorrense]|uniref:DMSO/TMAO reductase YedYZ, molybdopterin-dependent catalytic subunit n=1 Tax=Halobaculum gomorrense TaxID=43928 RepID=A0A1M5KY70_9EURY|nr:molybdopterin-dependent oxidoreductase [Halobaculum gomorrense]SHG57764.1 DMSO/TMAO reductase YedYZ, molybdopterin-dependent catalytic subunit [Halobaculum gomorrense]